MISILTSIDMPRIQEWYNKAINEPSVRRFLTLNTTWETVSDLTSDWANVHLMDSSNRGLAIINPGRIYGNQNGTLSVWVLPGSGQQLIAGRLVLKAFELAKAMNIKYISVWAHEDNRASRNLCQHLCESHRVGQTWPGAKIGVCIQEGWDPVLARWVDTHGFRINVSQFMENRQ